MKFLGEYIFSLSACLIISSVIFSACPQGTLKKTLRAVIGIVLALVAVSAFTKEVAAPDFSYENEAKPYVNEEKSREMEELITEQAVRLAEEKISERLGGKKVKITLERDGNIKKVEIENATKADKIVVSRDFKIEIEKIETF